MTRSRNIVQDTKNGAACPVEKEKKKENGGAACPVEKEKKKENGGAACEDQKEEESCSETDQCPGNFFLLREPVQLNLQENGYVLICGTPPPQKKTKKKRPGIPKINRLNLYSE